MLMNLPTALGPKSTMHKENIDYWAPFESNLYNVKMPKNISENLITYDTAFNKEHCLLF